MAKKTAAAKKPVAKKPAAKKSALRVVIDYPEAGAVVLPGHYAVRLTASGASQAQLRFDGGAWIDCRESLGHFWHDWSPQPGRANLESRARAGKGRWSPVAERGVIVKPNELTFAA